MSPFSLKTTLSLMIYGQSKLKSVDSVDFGYTVHDVFHTMMNNTGWSNARRADLYARIVEKARCFTSLIATEKIIAFALYQNARCFPKG